MKSLKPRNQRQNNSPTTRVQEKSHLSALEIDIMQWRATLLNQKPVPLPKTKQEALRRRYELRDPLDGQLLKTDKSPIELYDESETFRRYVAELKTLWEMLYKAKWLKNGGLVDSRLVASICVAGERTSKNPNATPGWFLYKEREESAIFEAQRHIKEPKGQGISPEDLMSIYGTTNI